MKQMTIRKIVLDDLIDMLTRFREEEHPLFVDVILIADEFQDAFGVTISQEDDTILPGKITDQDINQLI